MVPRCGCFRWPSAIRRPSSSTCAAGPRREGGCADLRAERAGLEFDEPFLAHYRPYHGDELPDSFTLRYRLLGRYRRPIGTARNGNETVDASAITRLRERTDGYAPSNLVEFCRRTGVAIT
jgi:hypothetical protein